MKDQKGGKKTLFKGRKRFRGWRNSREAREAGTQWSRKRLGIKVVKKVEAGPHRAFWVKVRGLDLDFEEVNSMIGFTCHQCEISHLNCTVYRQFYTFPSDETQLRRVLLPLPGQVTQ